MADLLKLKAYLSGELECPQCGCVMYREVKHHPRRHIVYCVHTNCPNRRVQYCVKPIEVEVERVKLDD